MLSKFRQLRHQGSNPFASMCNLGGGSDSGSGQVYYANQDKLLGVQADVASNMYNEYAKRAPTLLDNSNKMTAEAMDGTLANRLRTTAGNTAAASLATANNDTLRTMSRYGVAGDPSSGRMADAMSQTAIRGAAVRAGSMNQADQFAEDQKWNRNSGAFSQVAGMGPGAMQGLSSAASGYGSMANGMNQNAQANAAGMGQFGGAAAAQMFKKDGGYIEGESVRVDDKPGLRLAKGGCVKKGVKLAMGGMPTLGNWRDRPTTVQNMGSGPSAGMALMAGAAPVVAAEGLKFAGKEALNSEMGVGLRTALGHAVENVAPQTGAKMVMSANGMTDAEVLGMLDGAKTEGARSMATQGATSAATNTAVDTGVSTGIEAASTAGTDALATAGAEAATAAGAEAAGASALSTIGTALPYVGLALAAGKAFGLFSEGGEVEREDMTAGGEVDGPGTETSDDIPAWLSDGEYVLNAEAVKIVGKDKLDQINEEGLQQRAGLSSVTPKTKGGDVALAGGGFLGGNLGIAMGAGVQQYNAQRQQDRLDKAEVRADAADKRQQTMHDEQMAEIKRNNDERVAVQGVWKDANAALAGDTKAQAAYVQKLYNGQNPAAGYNDGTTVDVQHLPDGRVSATPKMADGTVGQAQVFTPDQVRGEVVRSVYSQLSGIKPEYGDRFINWMDSQAKENTRVTERKEDITHRDGREKVQDGQWQQNYKLHQQQVANSGAGLSLARDRWETEKGGVIAETDLKKIKVDAQSRLYKAQDEYSALTPDQQNSPEGQALYKTIQVLNNRVRDPKEFAPHTSTLPDGRGGGTVVVTDSNGVRTHRVDKNGQVVSGGQATGKKGPGLADANSAAQPPQAKKLPMPQSQKDFDSLPSGSSYIDPEDGLVYRKK